MPLFLIKWCIYKIVCMYVCRKITPSPRLWRRLEHRHERERARPLQRQTVRLTATAGSEVLLTGRHNVASSALKWTSASRQPPSCSAPLDKFHMMWIPDEVWNESRMRSFPPALPFPRLISFLNGARVNICLASERVWSDCPVQFQPFCCHQLCAWPLRCRGRTAARCCTAIRSTTPSYKHLSKPSSSSSMLSISIFIMQTSGKNWILHVCVYIKRRAGLVWAEVQPLLGLLKEDNACIIKRWKNEQQAFFSSKLTTAI